MEQNGHSAGHGSDQKQASEVSQGDLAMLSQSSQDQTQAMDEGTPPEKDPKNAHSASPTPYNL